MKAYQIEKQKWDKKSAQMLDGLQGLRAISTYEKVFSSCNTLKPVYRFFNLAGGNQTILDFGCGTGWTTVLLAQKARTVIAFDISSMSIKVLMSTMAHNSICNVHSFVGNAERLPFRDEVFDYVFGYAILHHLRLEPALSEIARVLRNGGKAAFCEPFGHNPVINFYRFIKHNYLEEIKGTDKPLQYRDKATFEKRFASVSFVETTFLSNKLRGIEPVDEKILEKFGFMKRFASYIAVLVQK